jgi:hypothetical protein
MMKKPVTTKAPAEQVVKDIRRATRKLHSSEEKVGPDRFVRPSWRRQHCRALPQRRHRPKPVLQLVQGILRSGQEAVGR